MRLEEITKGLMVTGLLPDRIATVVAVDQVSADVFNVVYKCEGNLGERQVFRADEASLSVAEKNLPWTFDASSEDFKRALEALRIRLGCRFDPMMAIHSSDVMPLPHQISAVYECMLPISPLRYVLADDPGAGKTVMAGLLIKELLMRADASRVLIVSPGSLTEQWQSELSKKFTIDFRIFSNQAQEESPSGNFFRDEDLVIARLDQLSRSEELQERLRQAPEWDLIVIDEAHKLSAHAGGEKINKTQRYRLGELLGSITRHFLLMTATPHNGKDADFQAWLALLDPDRFYGIGSANGGPIEVDSTIMRRLVKEKLLTFEGKRLFPPREAVTINYNLTGDEESLYKAVTDYVVHGWNQAQRIANPQQRTCIGFALTMLQRRLASSPEAIYQSLRRRHERLQERLDEVRRLEASGALPRVAEFVAPLAMQELPDLNDFDDDDLPDDEAEAAANGLVDNETAALNAEDLQEEVDTLSRLETQAAAICTPADGVVKDVKWSKLSELLQDRDYMFDRNGQRRKIIIFTEHRDTLNYLLRRCGDVLGNPAAVKAIHGGTHREVRAEIQDQFNYNPDVQVLIATDAAGEGVNLHQNCALMVNYDLPWNPCRLEQRFGRIHRIGQTEKCFLWNLVAVNTREGQVFQRLFEKIQEQREALHHDVFDILGTAFSDMSLRDMLIRAIVDGESAETRNWANEQVDTALDTVHLRQILDQNAIVNQAMTPESIYKIREEMERAQAKKLQPCYVREFFLSAMQHFGASVNRKPQQRYEIPHVPAVIRNAVKAANPRAPVSDKYEYVCFDRDHIRPAGTNRTAAFIHAGHPLIRAITDLTLADSRGILKAGTVMVDPSDEGTEPSLLFMIDHTITAGTDANKETLSREIQFVRMRENGTVERAGWAPHLDLEPASPAALALAAEVKNRSWISGDLEAKALAFATENVVTEHYETMKRRQLEHVDKVHNAVYTQLTKAINFYSRKLVELDAQSRRPDAPATLVPTMEKMRRKLDELRARLSERERKLTDEKHVVSEAPVVQGGIIVIPKGLLDRVENGVSPAQAAAPAAFSADADVRRQIELKAMEAVMAAERRLGFQPEDVSAQKCGWDVTSRRPAPAAAGGDGTAILPDRLIEVKGKGKDSNIVTISHNEICTAVNLKEKFILAIVVVDGEQVEGPYYVKDWVDHEPEPGTASVNYQLDYLLTKAKRPDEVL